MDHQHHWALDSSSPRKTSRLWLTIFCFATMNTCLRSTAAFIHPVSFSRTTTKSMISPLPSRLLQSSSGASFTNSAVVSSPPPKTKCNMTIADTPLGGEAGAALMDGLDVYTISAAEDDHPLSVYGICSEHPTHFNETKTQGSVSLSLCRPILLLHGRTWSSVPVYHLAGGGCRSDHESRSLMEALHENGLQPYAMDFRGFGGTPPDSTGFVEPNQCVSDVECVLKWIAKRHGLDSMQADNTYGLLHAEMPALLGWSQGALVAQLVAQKSPPLISKLTLYGSLYDPLARYPRKPLYTTTDKNSTGSTASVAAPPVRPLSSLDDAMEDFTIENTISPEAARLFAETALVADPHKAIWNRLYQFNNCDPARIHVPTLVVAGDQDPYAPLHLQAELFRNLGRGSDRTWSILADADHAAHLLDGRARFAKIVTSFVLNGKQSNQHGHFF